MKTIKEITDCIADKQLKQNVHDNLTWCENNFDTNVCKVFEVAEDTMGQMGICVSPTEFIENFCRCGVDNYEFFLYYVLVEDTWNSAWVQEDRNYEKMMQIMRIFSSME